jgi:hypothetical protein
MERVSLVLEKKKREGKIEQQHQKKENKRERKRVKSAQK